MQKYDGYQPVLTGWDRLIFNDRENVLVSILLDIDSGVETTDVYLSEANSNWDGGDMSDAAYAIDFLCDVLGIDYDDWEGSFVGGMARSIREEALTRDILGPEARHRSVGEYITSLAYALLPIEQDEDGSMWLDFRLRNAEGVEVVLRADGWFYTDYGEVDGGDLKGAYNEELYAGDSEVVHTLRFNADVLPPAA